MIELSICIPTFNRGQYLEKCLRSIDENLESLGDRKTKVEVIISDNDSSDDTQAIATGYSTKHPQITYQKNKQNFGSDYNIAKCYNSGAGKYVWVIGDDEQLTPNTLEYVLNIIEQSKLDYGVIFLNAYSYQDTEFAPPPNIRRNKIVDSDQILKKLHVRLTFISSLVVKKEQTIDASDFIGTSLIQFHYVLAILKNTAKHVITYRYSLIAKRENTGESDLSTGMKRVGIEFGDTFVSGVLAGIEQYTSDQKLMETMKRRLLLNYIIFDLAYVNYSYRHKSDVANLDDAYDAKRYYRWIIRPLLHKIEKKQCRFVLLFICFISRSINGDFFKILNFMLRNIRNVRFRQQIKMPSVLVDGYSTSDITYNDNQTWKEGTVISGNGFVDGGMSWDQSAGEVVVPTGGHYLVNWHPMMTNSDGHSGEQGWKIVINGDLETRREIAEHHWNGSGGSSTAFSTTIIAALEPQDKVRIEARATHNPRIYGGSAHTFLSVHFITK